MGKLTALNTSFMEKLVALNTPVNISHAKLAQSWVIRCKTKISGCAYSSKTKHAGANSKDPGCTPSSIAGSAPDPKHALNY